MKFWTKLPIVISAFVQMAYGQNIYKSPSGIDLENGATIVGFSSDPVYIHENRKADRDYICISHIDGSPVISFKLPQIDPLLNPAGTEDPTHCQNMAEFKYLLAPGMHSISVAYWDLDTFKYGYALTATFEVSLAAGQNLRLQRKPIGWSKTKLWIEDNEGGQVGDSHDVQYKGRRSIAFGQLVPQNKYTGFIPSRAVDPVYSGSPISRLSVDVILDAGFKDSVDAIRNGFVSRLRECGVAATVHSVLLDDKGAVAGESEERSDESETSPQPSPSDAKLTIVEQGFTYYAKKEALFEVASDPKKNVMNTRLEATLTQRDAKAPVWQSGVDVVFPKLMIKGLADAFVGRLSENGYLRGCAEIPKWDH